MARSRFTVGRAFALLILGIGIGAGLFVARRLRPDAVKQQVHDALAQFFEAEYSFSDAVLDVDTGVELIDLKVLYKDGTPALEAERVALTVDHEELLTGDVIVRQVDVKGLTVRLRPDPTNQDLPGLPGVFTGEGPKDGKKRDLPLIRVEPGKGGSHIELHNLRALRDGVVVRLDCLKAEASPDGPQYSITANFEGERIRHIAVRLIVNLVSSEVTLDADYSGLQWTRGDIESLSERLRAGIPPVEVAGLADGSVKGRLNPTALELSGVTATASLRDVHGAFGNLHTGEAKGLPFNVREGRGELRYHDGELTLTECVATYLPPQGAPGQLEADLKVDFLRVEPHIDFTLRGRGIRASTDDMRDMIDPSAIEPIVEQFRPDGTFDFVLHMSSRPAVPDKTWMDFSFTDCRCVYAGNLDELTGRRFGFRYPLERGSGRISVETHIPSPHGYADVFVVRNLQGFNEITRKRPGGPTDVAVRVDGRVVSYYPPGRASSDDIDIRIQVRDLPIDAKLATAFASTPRGTPYEAFALGGWAKRLLIRVEQTAFRDREARTTYDVELHDCSLAYEDFPLHVRGINGRILSEDEPDGSGRTLRFLDLRGVAADGGLVVANGLVRQSERGTETLTLDIKAEGLVLGEDMKQALLACKPVGETNLPDLWTKLRPEGRLNAHVQFSSADEVTVEINLTGHASLKGYEDIHCPIEGLTGRLIYDGDAVRLEEIRGRARDMPFVVDGTIRAGAFKLNGRIHKLHLDEAMRELIAEFDPAAAATLEEFGLAPESALAVALVIEREAADAPIRSRANLDDLNLVSRVQGLDVRIRGGPVELTTDTIRAPDLWLTSGNAEVHARNVVIRRGTKRRLRARVDARSLSTREHLVNLFGPALGQVLGRNLRVDLHAVELTVDEEDRIVTMRGGVELRRHELLDEKIDALEPTGTLKLSPITIRIPEATGGPIRFHGVVEFDGLNMNLPVPVGNMAGELLIAQGTLAPDFTVKGAVSGAQITAFDRYLDRLALNFTLRPDYLRLNSMDGRFYKGNFRGDVEVHLGDPGAFRVRLRMTDVELGEMLKEDLSRTEPMSGTLDAAIELESASGEPRHMQGRGEIRVREGQLIRVPGLRRILAVMARATPLAPRFKRAEVDFVIEGEELDVQRFHLSTRLNDIHGEGRVTIYGDLDLVIEPQVTRLIDLPRLINLPILSTLRDFWRKTVYEIRLEGTIDSPTLRLRGLPWLRKHVRPFAQSPHAGRAKRMRPRVLPR